jgi:predicted AAA+ superfamily ATPase
VKVSKEEIFRVLAKFNPWWNDEPGPPLPEWKRAVIREIRKWRKEPPDDRALMLSGARQVGKTTLFRQTIEELRAENFPVANILYATFDHPLLKLAGIDAIVDAWREFVPPAKGPEYLFLDEIQSIADWQVWVKQQVDDKKRRLAITGSAMRLAVEGEESGVGRWQTVRLPTLSFYEYLQIRGIQITGIAPMRSLLELFERDPKEFPRIAMSARRLSAHFNEYLLRSGFPQSAKIENIEEAQRLLREDIVEKILKRDMTALFGVRRILELEQLFLYLCMHDSGLLDVNELSASLGVNRQTAGSFISLLESTHLIYRLMPHGYGKNVLRGQPKIYLADPAIAGCVFLKGRSILDNPDSMGTTVETALFKHIYTHYYSKAVSFSYWRGKGGREVDIIAEAGTRTIPFEVKYRNEHTSLGDLKGLCEFCEENQIEHGYVITKEMDDLGVLTLSRIKASVAKIPAPLACYWLGKMEIDR